MGVNEAASRPRRQIEIKASGARGATRQRSVKPANAAFKGCLKNGDTVIIMVYYFIITRKCLKIRSTVDNAQ